MDSHFLLWFVRFCKNQGILQDQQTDDDNNDKIIKIASIPQAFKQANQDQDIGVIMNEPSSKTVSAKNSIPKTLFWSVCPADKKAGGLQTCSKTNVGGKRETDYV